MDALQFVAGHGCQWPDGIQDFRMAFFDLRLCLADSLRYVGTVYALPLTDDFILCRIFVLKNVLTGFIDFQLCRNFRIAGRARSQATQHQGNEDNRDGFLTWSLQFLANIRLQVLQGLKLLRIWLFRYVYQPYGRDTPCLRQCHISRIICG
jgi:hypothetical protein